VIAEAEFHADYGLAPAPVLAALTRNAAELLGREDDLGSLEAGKLADLIVVDGNPLAEISALWRVETVVKGGGWSRHRRPAGNRGIAPVVAAGPAKAVRPVPTPAACG